MAQALKDDARYQVAREWCGYSRPRWVARFCGEWLGQGVHRADALMICLAHSDKRERDIAALATLP